MTPTPPLLVLGSTSPARREALHRLGLRFRILDPGVDEDEVGGESPRHRAIRLARLKALAVRLRAPGAIVIASDQTAVCGKSILHKPRTLTEARASLRMTSGRRVDFYTALAVFAPGAKAPVLSCEETRVHLRRLREDEISRYVQSDRPLGCAGGFRAEGRGPSLWRTFECTDPTAIVGLPLIQLTRVLRRAGLPIP